MTFRAQEAIRWLYDDLGAVPEESALAICNDAGVHCIGMHGWACMEQTALLDAVAAQNYVGLPDNFRGLLEVVESGNGVPVYKTTSSVLISARNTLGSSFQFSGRVRNAVVANQFVPRLYLNPTPSSTTAGQFDLLYLAGWVELTKPTSDIILPFWMRALYRMCVVAFGRGYKEGTGSGAGVKALQEQLEYLKAGETFRVAREWDASANPSGGRMSGGMVETYNPGLYRTGRQLYDVQIADPSTS